MEIIIIHKSSTGILLVIYSKKNNPWNDPNEQTTIKRWNIKDPRWMFWHSMCVIHVINVYLSASRHHFNCLQTIAASHIQSTLLLHGSSEVTLNYATPIRQYSGSMSVDLWRELARFLDCMRCYSKWNFHSICHIFRTLSLLSTNYICLSKTIVQLRHHHKTELISIPSTNSICYLSLDTYEW